MSGHLAQAVSGTTTTNYCVPAGNECSECTASCVECGCCHRGCCRDPFVCWGPGVDQCTSPSSPPAQPAPPAPPAPPTDWFESTASYFNLLDPTQNHGYVGCVTCDYACGLDDGAWLVSRSTYGFDRGQCNRDIEIFSYDTSRSATVPIRDVMMAGDRHANDLDLTPAVARELGFDPTPDNFGSNKRIKWRFVS